MRYLLLLVFFVAAAVAGLCMLDQFEDCVQHIEQRGGTDEINVDSLNYWSITEDDLRAEDPEGFARLAEMEHTPERTAEAVKWSREVRGRIFERRYGYFYEWSDE